MDSSKLHHNFFVTLEKKQTLFGFKVKTYKILQVSFVSVSVDRTINSFQIDENCSKVYVACAGNRYPKAYNNNNIYISIAQISIKMFKCALQCRLKRLHICIINIKLIL